MAHWHADSPQLQKNLTAVLDAMQAASRRRDVPSIALARDWQRRTMAGLDVADPAWVGRFRGEPRLETIEVDVDGAPGVDATDVAGELSTFEQSLRAAVGALDKIVRKPALPSTADDSNAVIEVAAWAHAEWVRIHPFANGNGRTARLWANFILMRYGIAPYIRVRPRRDGAYAKAGAAAMTGDYLPTVALFKRIVAAAVPT